MNLMETVLRNCEAEMYIPTFKQQEIDAFTLKIFGDEDLKILGVDDEDKRKMILEQTANLQLAAEAHPEVIINQQYVHLILNQISAHLIKHIAVLSIVLNRRDVLVCDVKLSPATKCLQNCVYELEEKLKEVKKKIPIERHKSKKSRGIIVSSVLLATLLLASYGLHRFRLE